MSGINVHIRAALSSADAERLGLSQERGTRSRAWLAGQIIRQWLCNPRRRIIYPKLPRLPSKTTEAQARTVELRKSILDRWETAVKQRRRGTRIDHATDAFLGTLRAEGTLIMARATLYNWRRRYESNGLAGLIDRRSEKISATFQGSSRGRDRAS